MRRQRGRSRVVAWGAIGCGGLAVALSIAALGTSPETQNVLIASRDLPVGTIVGDEDISVQTLPVDARIGGAVIDPADAVGRQTVGPLGPGELVTEAVLGGDGVAPLAEGERAVPIPLSAVGGAAPGLVAGARVDVIASRGEGTLGRTEVVVTNAEVLAFERDAFGGGEISPSVVLRASSRDALQITSALNFARDVRLVVRPTNEPSGRSSSVVEEQP